MIASRSVEIDVESGRLLPSDTADRITHITQHLAASCEPPTQETFYNVMNVSPSGGFVVNTFARAVGILYYSYAMGWLDELEAHLWGGPMTRVGAGSSDADALLATVPAAVSAEQAMKVKAPQVSIVPSEYHANLRILARLLDRAGVEFARKPDDIEEPLQMLKYGANAIRGLVKSETPTAPLIDVELYDTLIPENEQIPPRNEGDAETYGG